MNLIKCPNNHYYDGDKYATCPHCANLGGNAGVTEPIADRGGSVMTACGNGHFYDSSKYSTCPYCQQEKDDKPTAPVEEPKKAASLADIIGESRKTIFTDDEPTISESMLQKGMPPVVGWLVCIEGEDAGKSFELKENRNFIGRSSNSDVVINGDKSVSREKHAVIIYEAVERIFIAQPGESRELYYINDKVVLNNVQLKAYDILKIGKTKLIFVPFCGETFCWNDLKKEDEK